MSQWLCLIAPLGSLPSSWSIPRSNCPRLTLTSHKIGRNCQKNGRYWEPVQEVDLLTFSYNLHQLTTSWNLPTCRNIWIGIQIMMDSNFKDTISGCYCPRTSKRKRTRLVILHHPHLKKHVLNLVMSMTGISDLSWASLIPGTASIMSCKVPSQKTFCWAYIPRRKHSKASS